MKFIYSYSLRIFFASRRAYPATFSVHTDFKKMCYIQDFLSVSTINSKYPNDGQIKYVYILVMMMANDGVDW